MASTTIRKLDESVKQKLRLQAAMHGCSMEEEARRILGEALLPQKEAGTGLGIRIHKCFADAGGIDLKVQPRSLPRPSPVKDEGVDR